MKPRYSTFLFLVFCATAAQGVMSTAAGQSPTSDAGGWEVPRTSDGHPDLQGNWTNGTLTPFEREEGRVRCSHGRKSRISSGDRRVSLKPRDGRVRKGGQPRG